jgi:hypothetical protein
MTKIDFYSFWNSRYPNFQPVSACFYKNMSTTWFRIHSLPESKRYADTQEEYEEIFFRQNTLLDDLIPQNTTIQIVINFISSHNSLFDIYDFENIGVIVDEEGETTYQSFVIEQEWKTNSINNILKEIADDNIRAFIIVPEALIAPYDGGMNLYLNDIETRDFYKKRYSSWLSKREDGL